MNACVRGVLVVAMLGLVGTACSSTTSVKSDNGQDVSLARASAFGVCEKFVKQRLKAPGTATFRDPYGDQVTYSGDDKGPITVDASVDSENSFGAKLRLPYSCTVTNASGDTWTLDNLNIQDAG